MAFGKSREPGSGSLSQSDAWSPPSYQNERKGFQSYADRMPAEFEYYEAPLNTVTRSKRKSFKHWFFFVFSLILGIAWLAPIFYLLYLNISYSVIGAAAWCPGHSCGIISYFTGTNVSRAELSAKYDKDNHNLLGALQFAAKALEVWFVYIATSLVYLVTRFLAKRPGGLPIGYLLTHLEYADLRLIFDPILWSAPSQGKRRTIVEGHHHTMHLYIFGILAVAMCIIANLMGPSVAVLLIPTLQWENTPQLPESQFGDMLAGAPPAGNAIPGCNPADLAAGFTICTTYVYGASLDALIQASRDQIVQNVQIPYNADGNYLSSNAPTAIEQAVPFIFNISYAKNNQKSSETLWAPNRQVLRSLSDDLQGLYNVVRGNSSNQTFIQRYSPYNNSLSIVLQRQGPVIGMPAFLSDGLLSVTKVASDRQIRCYAGFSTVTKKSKCLRTGVGWNTSDAITSFSIDGDESRSSKIVITSFWSDKAAYADITQDPCFVNGTLPSDANCDYDNIFAAADPADPQDQTADTYVLEYSLPTSHNPEAVLIFEAFPVIGFATYSLDASTVLPNIPNAEISNPPAPDNVQPMVLNPSWILAAWSINANEDVPPNRASSVSVQDSVVYMQKYLVENVGTEAVFYEWFAQWLDCSIYTLLQAASLVAFTSTPAQSLQSTSQHPDQQPVLWTNVYRQVWGFGIDSRTSKLGIAVAVLGSLVVIARTALLLITHERGRSTTELMATALEHRHTGELDHAEKELDLAKVRYRLCENHGADKIRLLPVTATRAAVSTP